MIANGNSFNGSASMGWKPPMPAKPGIESRLFKYLTAIPGEMA